MRRDSVDELYDESGTASTMPPAQKTYTIPQRSTSRAPSQAVDVDLPTSDSTVRDDEETDMHGDDQADDRSEAMQSFGQRSRQLIKVIQKLEALGITAELSLPKFVVVGDQSHGKSSIIEAICGISLPRSSGTCTRCPFRITTTATRPGEDWSCKIALLRRYVCQRNGKDWHDTHASDPVYFTTVTDRADLGRVLQLAQVAILNPTLDPSTVLQTGAPSTMRSLSFSYNPIELCIARHELPELSMIDLPGSINVAPNETEQHLVVLIEKLIKAYVRDEKALILLVASIDQDLETSTAFRVVGGCKGTNALGRSMGVLTKADLFLNTKSRVEHVRQTLAGEKFKLGNGWFVTKNSSQEELDRSITHVEAREREAEFFGGVPWSANLVDFVDRFGTTHLQDAISHRLVDHIESELPEIIARVNERLSTVSDKLDRMPERPSNPSQTVIEELQKLIDAVKELLLGNDDNAKFRSDFKGLIRGFRSQLSMCRPHVVLSTPGYVKPVLSLDSDNETMSDAPTPSKRHKTNSGQPAPSPTPRSGLRGGSQDRPNSESAARATFTLDQIHAALDQARTSDMQDQVHPKVVERFIRQSIKSWPKLTTDLLKAVQKLIGDMLEECTGTSLALRAQTALVGRVSEAVKAIYHEIHAEEINHIDHVVRCEMHKPISYTGGLKTEEVRTKLQNTRISQRLDEHYDTMEAEKHAKVPIGQKRIELVRDLAFVQKTLGADQFATEVTAMASPLAYYDLAAARLTDTVANHLEYGIMHTIETKLQVQLMLELRVTDSAYCTELLAEDPGREAERQRLIALQEKLLKAVEELKSLPGQH